MSIIEPTHVTINDSTQTTYQDMITNAKAILYEIDKGIMTIIKGGHQSYDLSSGQGSRSVRRLSLIELKDLRKEVLSQIADLEIYLGIRKSVIQVCPGW